MKRTNILLVCALLVCGALSYANTAGVPQYQSFVDYQLTNGYVDDEDPVYLAYLDSLWEIDHPNEVLVEEPFDPDDVKRPKANGETCTRDVLGGRQCVGATCSVKCYNKTCTTRRKGKIVGIPDEKKVDLSKGSCCNNWPDAPPVSSTGVPRCSD